MKKRKNSIAAELIKGAVAGAIATWVMDRVTWYMYRNEDRKAFLQEKEAQVEGKLVSEVAIDKIFGPKAAKLTDRQHWAAAKGVRYFFGVTPAMLYAVMRHNVKGLNAGRGALFGLGLYLVVDEVMVPLVGWASGPTAFPWQAHTRGLVGHVTLGVVADGVLNALDEALHS